MNLAIFLSTFLLATFTANAQLTPPKTAATTKPNLTWTNPIMPGADPHAILISNTFWVYPTWTMRGEQQFYAFSSTNLADWQRHGPILDFKNIPWIKEDSAPIHYAWAPAIFSTNGKFYFYYSVGPQNPTAARIGVAVGDSPAGPFNDSGKPLLTGGNGFEAIDPFVFRDPKSNSTYLYAGGSAGATLRAFELNPDMISFAREIPIKTPDKFTEGVSMHFHRGVYYLTYSHGVWRHSSYSVHYSTSDSPTGPWIYRGPILTSDETHKGPGHHSFLQDPRTGDCLIFYHRWENQSGNGPYRGSRHVSIERVEHDPEGFIRPIRMSGASLRQTQSASAELP